MAIHPRHKIDENSLTAYRKLVAAGRITERDAEVMDLVRRNPGSTAIELADAYASTYHLRVPYPDANLVRPSITRLVQQGWLKYGPNKKDPHTGHAAHSVYLEEEHVDLHTGLFDGQG